MDNILLDIDQEGTGEIGTRSRNTFMGYHMDEKRTKEAFDKVSYRLRQNYESKVIHNIEVTMIFSAYSSHKTDYFHIR